MDDGTYTMIKVGEGLRRRLDEDPDAGTRVRRGLPMCR